MTRSRTDRAWIEEVVLPATALGLVVAAVVVLELASVATGVLSGAGRLLLVGFDDLSELNRPGFTAGGLVASDHLADGSVSA
ncbi:hypothetical protein [Pseudonocardia sp. HH130630-07]|uniref:hypothetical protein n=1 Tax=Pseudonocardia sp. HH130630-07 TaxID=1690815 RepID=UPI0012EA58C2|nr:hypothetical protein [Pseudonocardia sp. HH130630-07]